MHPLPPPFSPSFLRFNLQSSSLGTVISLVPPNCPSPPCNHSLLALGPVVDASAFPAIGWSLQCLSGRPCLHSEIKSETWINLSVFSSHLGLLLWCWWLVIKDLLVWEIKSSYTNINGSRPWLSQRNCTKNSDYGCQFLPFLRYCRANLAIAGLTLFVRYAVYH